MDKGVILGGVYWVKNEFEVCWAYERNQKFVIKVINKCERNWLSSKISFCVGSAISAAIGSSKLSTTSIFFSQFTSLASSFKAKKKELRAVSS